MENFSTLIENSKRAVRYWWLLLIIGIALFVVGILVFVYPTQSYLGMSLLFGWLMLISGILEVVLSSVNKHFITGRGWMLAGGIIEIVLGIILIFNVALSAATLPIFLGFWLMLRAFGAIGLGSDMGAMQIAGSGWTIFSGILLLLCSLWILFQPLVFGTTAVIVWVGISLPRHITHKPLPRQGLFRTRPCKILKHQGEQGSRSPPENTPPRPPR